MPLFPGTRLGPYEITALIGSGRPRPFHREFEHGSAGASVVFGDSDVNVLLTCEGHAHSISATPSQEATDDAEPAPVRLRSRRSFVTFARGSKALAPDYDLIVKGGHVIDLSLRVNAIRDVAIAGGRIATVEANIAADAAEVIDATDKLVVPGLLDVHTHYARDKEGPTVCLADGVTGWVDAGSEDADQIDDMVTIARSAPQPGRVLINIGRAGVLPDGDTMGLGLARERV